MKLRVLIIIVLSILCISFVHSLDTDYLIAYYNMSSPTDSWSGGYDLSTGIGSVSYGSSGCAVGNCGDFDTNDCLYNDAIVSGVLSAQENGSICFWVDRDSTAGMCYMSLTDFSSSGNWNVYQQSASGTCGASGDYLQRSGAYGWLQTQGECGMYEAHNNFYCFVQDGNYISVYKNATNITNLDETANPEYWWNDILNFDRFAVGCLAYNSGWNFRWDGIIDEISLWSEAIDEDLISGLYNNSFGCNPINHDCSGVPPPVNDTEPPVITDVTQDPTNLTVLNAVESGLNISATITDNIQLNLTSIQLNLNTSDIHQCIAGVCVNISDQWINYTNVSGSRYSWILDENQFLSSTGNLDHEVFETEPRLNNTLSTANQWVRILFYNVTNNHDLVFTEIMDTNSTGVAEYYYCNENYSTGNPIGSNWCTKFYTQTGADTIHVHQNNNWHRILPMAINETGFLNDVIVSEFSYILKRGSNDDETYFYVNNDSSSTWTTNNNGNSWSSQTYTVDAHLHILDRNDTIFYSVCAGDNSSNYNCSAVFNDTIDFPILPPTPVEIFIPEADESYNVTINITYSESQTLTGGTIDGYLIEYQRGNLTSWVEIIDDNYPNLNYLWSIDNLNNDNYRIRITVSDTNNLTAVTVSDYFVIANELDLDTQLLQAILDELTAQSSIFDRIEGGIMLIALVFMFVLFFIFAFVGRMYWLLSLDGVISVLIALLSWNYISSTDYFQRAMVWIFLFLGIGLLLLGVGLQILYAIEFKKRPSKYELY